MDNFSKTGMHMSESSMMMMGSKLKLAQLSTNANGVGASYRWYGKLMGMTMDFSETVTKWQPPKLKEWETIGEAKLLSCHGIACGLKLLRLKTEQSQNFQSAICRQSWYFKILSFIFAKWYCNWCLNNMLNDTKKELEKISKQN
jgi:hypothetical protein